MPDDETIGCAGVTLQAVARGERVGIVVLTQGDGHARLTAVVAKKPLAQLGPDDFVRAGVVRQGHTPARGGEFGRGGKRPRFSGPSRREAMMSKDEEAKLSHRFGKSETAAK